MAETASLPDLMVETDADTEKAAGSITQGIPEREVQS